MSSDRFLVGIGRAEAPATLTAPGRSGVQVRSAMGDGRGGNLQRVEDVPYRRKAMVPETGQSILSAGCPGAFETKQSRRKWLWRRVGLQRKTREGYRLQDGRKLTGTDNGGEIVGKK